MRITYDTDLDQISSPDLGPEQTRVLQAELALALAKNEPVREVADRLLRAARNVR